MDRSAGAQGVIQQERGMRERSYHIAKESISPLGLQILKCKLGTMGQLGKQVQVDSRGLDCMLRKHQGRGFLPRVERS